ncbi:MAG: hypothetical protein GIKADHBN_00150 [Phycisphaerales bacterium]|nr:hypothetical protein [Phycisphaerales bacterium]
MLRTAQIADEQYPINLRAADQCETVPPTLGTRLLNTCTPSGCDTRESQEDDRSWQGKDAEALREYRDVLRDIDDLMYSDVVEKQRALLGLAELHAARGEDAEAEAIALRAIETTSGGTTGEELERRRAELVLGVVRACRGDLEAATPLLTGAAHIVTPASWQYANPTTKRMVLRLVKAYQGHPYAEVLSRFPDVGATDLQR